MAAEGGAMSGSEAQIPAGADHDRFAAEAMELARAAVESRLAACAQVAGP